MVEQTGQPNLARPRVLQAATIIPAAVVGTLIVASPAEAAYRGKIKRSEVMKRAKNWYDRDIQYDRGRTALDVDRKHRYRQDCSGFVSMCLHSPTPGHSTRTLPNIAKKIKWSELKPGDFLNSYDNHCMLFDSWSAKKGWLWMYDLATPALDMRHKRIAVDAAQSQNYKPYRYRDIVNG